MDYLVNPGKWLRDNGKKTLCPKVTSCMINAPNANVCKVDINNNSNETHPKKGCVIQIG